VLLGGGLGGLRRTAAPGEEQRGMAMRMNIQNSVGGHGRHNPHDRATGVCVCTGW